MRTRTVNMDAEIGDPSAFEGTGPWATFLRGSLIRQLREDGQDRTKFERDIRRFGQYRGWERLQKRGGEYFSSFLEFVTHPEPEGLGKDLAYIVGVGKLSTQELAEFLKDKPLADHRRPTVEESNKGDIITFKKGTTCKTYLIRRLWRDRPDIAEKLAKGEYTSARQAAIAAGIIKIPSALEVAVKALRKLPEVERTTALLPVLPAVGTSPTDRDESVAISDVGALHRDGAGCVVADHGSRPGSVVCHEIVYNLEDEKGNRTPYRRVPYLLRVLVGAVCRFSIETEIHYFATT